MDINHVAIIGSGTMGRQIALNAALSGYHTTLTDSFDEARRSAAAWADQYLSERIKKGRLTGKQTEDARACFTITNTLQEAVKDADLVIEAVVEQEEIKKAVFREISLYAPKDAILTTNSSRMPSSMFVSCVNAPDKLANLHYNNPALVMKGVEIQQNPFTSEDTVESLLAFVLSVGKTPIRIHKEIDGLVCSRFVHAINEVALYLVENGYCSIEDVDNACTAGLNHPMGPFRLMDLTGLDLNFDIRNNEYLRTGIKPIGYDLFRSYVEQGRTGKKSGHGFYDYE